ncbi:MAG TPA: hypothetical protein VHO01_01705 [Jatrophihabitans sp.]|nr:hypothetical protein [Jatrophihabitans sp.]
MDRDAAAAFLTRHARLLDRLRFALLTGTGGPGVAEAMLAALAGYRNADGGYGWGIEPDLRDQTSQPAGALHAFEVLAELPATVPGAQRHAEHLCNWLDRVARPDGGLPFALPVASPAGVAPFWAGADPTSSSL